jgi:AcrR family transcriptional regulator
MSSPPEPRERILRAAMQLFAEHGFAETTMLQIATRARVSKRELYALVGNKDEMLAMCVARRGGRMRLPEGFPDPTNRATLEGALKKYGATLLRELLDPDVMEVFRLGIAEAKRSAAIAKSLSEGGRGPARAALERLLASARAANLLDDAEMPDLIRHFDSLLGWSTFMVWALIGVEKSPTAKEIDHRAAEAAAIFLELHGR